jgi:hypothetical protein
VLSSLKQMPAIRNYTRSDVSTNWRKAIPKHELFLSMSFAQLAERQKKVDTSSFKPRRLPPLGSVRAINCQRFRPLLLGAAGRRN